MARKATSLAQEAGSEQPYEEIVQLKMPLPDGKQRLTDVATAAKARNQLESQTGKSVVSGSNYLPPATTKAVKAVKAPKNP